MAKKAKSEGAKDQHITDGGVVFEGNVVKGEENKLTAKEQGQLARGEIDESGEKTGKEIEKPDAKTVKSKHTLYVGKLSASAESAKTGEPISYVWEQMMPVTEEGAYRVFEAAHGVGSVLRDTFKLDPSNEIDPTLRTALERP